MAGHMRTILTAAVVLAATTAALGVGAARAAPPGAPAPALTTDAGIAAARTFARTRDGAVGFAVVDGRGRLRGWHRTVAFPSASVTKAMLLVAALRRAGDRSLAARERALLEPMVTASDNDAADAVYASVGGTALVALARIAGCRRFAETGHWAAARITPADQARLFMRIDDLVPAAHRAFARLLLSSIVPPQRWGIAAVAARRGMAILFKADGAAGSSTRSRCSSAAGGGSRWRS